MLRLTLACLACASCATTTGAREMRLAQTDTAETAAPVRVEWTPGPMFWTGVGCAGGGVASLVVSVIYSNKVSKTEAEVLALPAFDGIPGEDDPVCAELASDGETCARGPLADLDRRGDRESTIRMVTLIGGVGLLAAGVVLGSADMTRTRVTVAPTAGGGALVLTTPF